MGATYKHITSRIGTTIAEDGVSGDLQVCFGSSQKSKYWYFVTNAANIWKWARFKPFRKNATYTDHYDDSGSVRKSDAAAKNYGLGAPTPSNQNQPLQTLTARTSSANYNTWDYLNPRGTAYDEPLRVEDFEGYNGEATPPVDPIGDETIQISAQSTYSFGARISHNPAGGDAIAWADLPVSVGNYYLCAIFGKADLTSSYTGDLIAKTSTQTIGTQGITLDLSHDELELLRQNGYNHYYLVGRSAILKNSNNEVKLLAPNTNTATYLALPSQNNSNDLKGEFNLIAASLQYVNVVGIALMQSPTRDLDYLNPSDYLGQESTNPQSSQYCDVSRNGATQDYYMHFKLKIKAGGDSFTMSNAKISLSHTFFSSSGFSSPVNCTIYNSSYQQRDATIAAGQEGIVYLVASAPIFSLNSNGRADTGAANQYFSSIIRIYKGSTLIDQTNEIRVRNYNF